MKICGETTPKEIYHARLRRFEEERDRLSGRFERFAKLRLAAFALGAGLSVFGVWRAEILPVLAGAALAVAFFFLASRHATLRRARRRSEELCEINGEASRRLERAWDELPIRHVAHAGENHPYGADLGLFGRASVFQLLEANVTTAVGEETLAGWLLGPAPPEEVRERQTAVAELAPLLDLRQELAVRGRLRADADANPEPLLAWAEGPGHLRERRWIVWGGRVSVVLLWVSLLAYYPAGLTQLPFFVVFLLVNAALGLALKYASGEDAYQTLTLIASHKSAIGSYAEMFELLAQAGFETAPMKHLQRKMTSDADRPAHLELKRLQRLSGLLIPRNALLYGFVQAFTLWDLHVLEGLERWQGENGGRVRGWLSALGEAEALFSLAGLSHDNPGWAFPEIDPDARSLEARGLGHPLIVEGVRVSNDITVGPEGTFLLVTGSNMSGKSTLLGAVGVNLVLAGAGGTVCAEALRTPPVRLWTSVRARDGELSEGTSRFMAELGRLKQVVEAARTKTGHERLFFLLDEVLQGTNTEERQVAGRRIIAHLVGRGAIGAVSTHDLALAENEPLASMARLVHFEENIRAEGNGVARMSFDYKLRPDLATSTNALSLMEVIGLKLDPEQDTPKGSSEGE